MSDKEKKERLRAILTARSRKRCILAGAGLVVLCAAGFIAALLPRYDQTEQALYSCELTADASYRVHILPNALYPGEWMEEGALYSSALADLVEVTFRADVRGDAPARISGSYRVGAVLEGYQPSGEEKKTVYRIEDPLAEGTLETLSADGAGAERTLRLSLAEYRKRSDEADFALGLTVSRDFSLEFSGTAYIDTAYGKKQEDFSYILALPLPKNAALFEIQKPEPVQSPGQITELREIRRPARTDLLWIFGGIGAASAVLALFAAFFTRLPTEREAERAALEKLRRKYGGRMIRLARMPECGERARVPVSDMNGLLAMAEELRLPACYCPDLRGLPQDGRCFIVAPECVYEYRPPSA